MTSVGLASVPFPRASSSTSASSSVALARGVNWVRFSGTMCGFDAEEIAAHAELEGVLAPAPWD